MSPDELDFQLAVKVIRESDSVEVLQAAGRFLLAEIESLKNALDTANAQFDQMNDIAKRAIELSKDNLERIKEANTRLDSMADVAKRAADLGFKALRGRNETK